MNLEPGLPGPRVSIVVLTHDRLQSLDRTLRQLAVLPGQPAIIVVDNNSSDGSAAHVKRHFPKVEVVCCATNQGAAGRNAGVRRVRTPYVAFCDDDSWWEAHALDRAMHLLDAHPRLGAVAARVLVGPHDQPEEACELMAKSRIEADGVPGQRQLSFMAGAVVMRTQAFRDVGGYEPRLFLGAEAQLMGLDLATRGWQISYAPDVVVHHHPASTSRESRAMQLLTARNRLWIAWLRLPMAHAMEETMRTLRTASGDGVMNACLQETLDGLPWALRNRRVIPDHVQALWQQSIHQGTHKLASEATGRTDTLEAV